MLIDIFNEISSVMAAQLPSQSIIFAFGPFAAAAKTTPPQVTWQLGPERFGPADPSSRTPGVLHPVQTPRAFGTRISTIIAKIWGQSSTQQFGPIFKEGSSTGGILPSLTDLTGVALPPNSFLLVVKMIAPGAVGVATYQWSSDGGKTFSATQTTSLLAVALGATGFSLTFTAGTFYAGDTFAVDCFALQVVDYSSTEYLLLNYLWALHRVCRGSYQLVGGRWEGQDGTEVIQLGKQYELTHEVKSPAFEVGAQAAQKQIILSLQQNVGMQFLNGNQVGGIPSY